VFKEKGFNNAIVTQGTRDVQNVSHRGRYTSGKSSLFILIFCQKFKFILLLPLVKLGSLSRGGFLQGCLSS